MIHGARWFLLLLVVPLLLGCAAGAPSREPEPQSSSPRVRCLTDSERDSREGTRPLFFFFCIESP